MSSLTFGSIRFSVYPNDHQPRHVHGALGSARVIVDILDNGDVQLDDRIGAIRPKDAKKSDVRKVLQSAVDHSDQLKTLWEKVHGKS